MKRGRNDESDVWPVFKPPVKRRRLDRDAVEKVGFFGPNKPRGEFSNWHPCTFVLDGTHYNCSEQAYMAAKAVHFKDDVARDKIMAADNPRRQKYYGSARGGFKNYNEKQWAVVRYDIMTRVLEAKFSQNPKLRDMLVGTGTAYIFEASPYDRVWGVGTASANSKFWKDDAQNLLGHALMDVRAHILASEQ